MIISLLELPLSPTRYGSSLRYNGQALVGCSTTRWVTVFYVQYHLKKHILDYVGLSLPRYGTRASNPNAIQTRWCKMRLCYVNISLFNWSTVWKCYTCCSYHFRMELFQIYIFFLRVRTRQVASVWLRMLELGTGGALYTPCLINIQVNRHKVKIVSQLFSLFSRTFLIRSCQSL